MSILYFSDSLESLEQYLKRSIEAEDEALLATSAATPRDGMVWLSNPPPKRPQGKPYLRCRRYTQISLPPFGVK